MNMSEITNDLRQLTRTLLLIDLSELEEHYKTNQRQVQMAKQFGSIFDPTGYREAIQKGELENAELQSEMCKHLIEARKVIEKLHPNVKFQIITGFGLDEDESE